MDSILDSTKKVLGLDPSYTAFDTDIILAINTVLSDLYQLGIGPTTGYEVTGSTETWTEYLGGNAITLNNVKTYVYLRVRLIFDPPQTSFGLQAFNRQIDELAWRINARREEIEHPWTPPITPG